MSPALWILAYIATGAIVSGLLRRVGILDDIDEAVGGHVICGIFWPVTLVVVLFRVTIGALLALIYRLIGGAS